MLGVGGLILIVMLKNVSKRFWNSISEASYAKAPPSMGKGGVTANVSGQNWCLNRFLKLSPREVIAKTSIPFVVLNKSICDNPIKQG